MENIFYFTESMEDSFIYKTFNNSSDILTKMVTVLKIGSICDKGHIEDQYSQIKRSSISPLSHAVLDAFDKGRIELIYHDNRVKLPTTIPFIVRKGNDGNPVASIFIKGFSKLNPDGTLDINPKVLYGLMEPAYIAMRYHEEPYRLTRSVPILRVCNHVYTNMMYKLMIRDYAITLDQSLNDSVMYAFSKFFLKNMWGLTNPDVIRSYAKSLILNPDPIAIEMIDDGFDKADIKDISDLLNFIKGINPRLKELNIKFVIERYVNTYGACSIMAMDYLPYLIFVINNTLISSFIINQNTLADIVKSAKGVSQYYSELAKIY